MPQHITDTDRKFLNLAVDSAENAYKLGNYPIGAVLSVNGELLGCGENKINEKMIRLYKEMVV